MLLPTHPHGKASIFPYIYQAQPSTVLSSLEKSSFWILIMDVWMGSKGPLGLPRLCFLEVFSWTGWKGRFLRAGREYEKENKQNGETAGVWMPEFLLNFVQGDLTCSLLFLWKQGQMDMGLPHGQTGTPACFLKIHGHFSLWSWNWYTNIKKDSRLFTSFLSWLSLSML